MEASNLDSNYDFYVLFPGKYNNRVKDIEKDIIDIFVIKKTNLSLVYTASLYTIKILNEMFNNGYIYISEKGMVVIRDLERKTIYQCIDEMINEENFQNVFYEIGSYNTVFGVDNFRYDLL
ncbi:hypothetical protein ABEG63_01210 [Chryseobacterium sp. C39-AII1]|uniref:hypothetical protein n=1 Tax=Chryseobacterium sp. C39-AII1 TaxID=3080332 RepID=UPI0032097737